MLSRSVGTGIQRWRRPLKNGIAEVVGSAEVNRQGYYNELDFSRALESIWRCIAQVDNYLTMEKPWALAKDPTNQRQIEEILYDAGEALRIVLVLAHPVLPVATQRMWEQLGQRGQIEDQRIDQLSWGGLRAGTHIGELAAAFPRVEPKETLEKIMALESEITQSKPQQPAAPGQPAASQGAAVPPAAPAPAASAPAAGAAPLAGARIGIEDFAKVEMRVGIVKSAERVAGADKLLKLMVDIGDEVRQVVAGIATAYEAERLVGRKVVVVTNLQPRKLRGVESNGMILAASTPDGQPVLASFLEEVPVGARLK